ncbi:MAG: hypothetical protein HQK65_08735 [Desulfamplus sp.]|nr:hypothetical protein [Desulfamplus sp.]
MHSLIAFMKNPVKSFFNQRLRVYFDDIDIAAENQEPFDLEKFALFGHGRQMLDAGLSAQPERRVEAVKKVADQLLRTGQMPVNAFGKIAVGKLFDSVLEMVKFHDKLCLDWPSEADTVKIDLPISIKECGIKSLDGLIDNLHKRTWPDSASPNNENETVHFHGKKEIQTLHHKEPLFARWEFYTGEIFDNKNGQFSRPDALVSIWVKHLAGCAHGLNLTSCLISTNGVAALSTLDTKTAICLLNEVINHWWLAMRYPLPVTAKTAMAYLGGLNLTGENLESTDKDLDSSGISYGFADAHELSGFISENDSQKAEKNARIKYEGDGYNSDGELGYSRYLQRVFPDFDSLWQAENNRFVQLAIKLYLPILKHAKSY